MRCKLLKFLGNSLLIIASINLLSGCTEYAKKYEQAVQSAKSAYNSATGSKSYNNSPAQHNNNNAGSSKTATNKPGELKFHDSDPADQAMDNSLYKKEKYFEREQYFKDIEPEKYGVKKVSAPDEDFINLYIPTYMGLPRVGVNPQQGETAAMNNTTFKSSEPRELKIKKALSKRMTNDIVSYVNLGLLASKKKFMTVERLKVDKSGLPDNKKNSPKMANGYRQALFGYKEFYPRKELEFSAMRVLSPSVYKSYFCGEKGNCLANYGNRDGGRRFADWGGRSASEFQSRKIFHEFINKMPAKFIRWGAKQSRNVYVIGTASVSKYDFSKKGVLVNLNVPTVMSKSVSSNYNKMLQNRMFYKPRNKALDIFKGYPNSLPSIFLSMNEKKGEAFIKRMKKQHDQVYFAFKARFYGIEPRRNYGNLFEPLEKKIEFYMDADLKEKFHTATKF